MGFHGLPDTNSREGVVLGSAQGLGHCCLTCRKDLPFRNTCLGAVEDLPYSVFSFFLFSIQVFLLFWFWEEREKALGGAGGGGDLFPDSIHTSLQVIKIW